MPADREIRVKNLRHNIRYQDLFKVKAQKLIWQREKKITKIFWNIIGVKKSSWSKYVQPWTEVVYLY